MSLILRVFFHLLYHEFAWAYDFISAFVSGGRWNKWIKSIYPLVQGPAILELGPGPGHLLLDLEQGGFQAVGLDSSRQMVGRAKRRLSRHRFDPALVCGRAEALPFCDRSFNTLVATFPPAFIFQSGTLREVRRVLKPGGILVVLLSAWITDRSLLSRFLTWLFQITGQTPPVQLDEHRLLKPFTDSGLDASLQWITLPGSRLVCVIASDTVPLDSLTHLY